MLTTLLHENPSDYTAVVSTIVLILIIGRLIDRFVNKD